VRSLRRNAASRQRRPPLLNGSLHRRQEQGPDSNLRRLGNVTLYQLNLRPRGNGKIAVDGDRRDSPLPADSEASNRADLTRLAAPPARCSRIPHCAFHPVEARAALQRPTFPEALRCDPLAGAGAWPAWDRINRREEK
jgi:hypothetical protein